MLAIIIKNARLQKKLTQTQLASLAGVSLPTLQNIEGDRANPSWSVVQSLLSSLAINFEFQPIERKSLLVDIANQNRNFAQFTSDEFALYLKAHLKNSDLSNLKSRDLDQLNALFFALDSSYPNWLKKNKINLQKYIRLNKDSNSMNRLLKLRRIWLNHLAKVI